MKETKYTVTLPQLRQHPPLPALPVVANFDGKVPSNASIPAPPTPNIKLNANAQTWVPYEQGAPSYWSQKAELADSGNSAAPASGVREKSLIELLRDDCKVEEAKPKTEASEPKPFQRHCLNCPNEPGDSLCCARCIRTSR